MVWALSFFRWQGDRLSLVFWALIQMPRKANFYHKKARFHYTVYLDYEICANVSFCVFVFLLVAADCDYSRWGGRGDTMGALGLKGE